MTSKTAICNKALVKIGRNTSINIDTDQSKEATRCKAAYDDILEEILREHNWNFAIFRQALNRNTSITPTYGYSYAFVLPTVPSLIKIIEVENNIDYKIENNYLLTNELSVKLRFVGKETNPNKYDSLFIDCFATRLAAEICYSLTGDKSLMQVLEERYYLKLSSAKDKDHQEDNQEATRKSRFNNSRFVSTDTFDTFGPINA